MLWKVDVLPKLHVKKVHTKVLFRNSRRIYCPRPTQGASPVITEGYLYAQQIYVAYFYLLILYKLCINLFMLSTNPGSRHWPFCCNNSRIGYFTKIQNMACFRMLSVCKRPDLGLGKCEMFKLTLLYK